MGKYICNVDVSLQVTKCLVEVGQVWRCCCIPSVVDQRFPYPAEEAFLTFLQPTPNLSLRQCGVDREDPINLSL
ncbi:MAG: hypothetical protein HYY12_06560 [Candidatus Methylomirabilis oxyfera]|nr:hypothetical protein [Candidatus Methylomirabilis oxyfera]